MNFREVIDFLNHEERCTETVVSPDEITILTGLETLIGKAYRFTKIFVKTPEDAMRWILWTLFYFVQQERGITDKDEDVVLEACLSRPLPGMLLTDKDEDVVLEALADAKANAAFCKKDEEGK